MDELAALRALRLFNEKAEKLDSLSFTKQVFSEKFGYSLNISQGRMRWSRHGPDAESIDAFCLTIRFFVQDNEPSSFRNLSAVYAFLHGQGIIDKATVDEYEQARALFTVLRQSIPLTPVIYQGHNYSPWEVFDVFLYGGLAHSKPEKRALYDRWQTIHPLFLVMEHTFVQTLAQIVKIIDIVRPLNVAAIEAVTTAAGIA